MSDTDFCFMPRLALVGVSSPPLLLFLRLRFLDLAVSSLVALVVVCCLSLAGTETEEEDSLVPM